MPDKSIKQRLAEHNLRPRKGLGQNFLMDHFHLEQIVASADLTPTDVVLEIGPGPGTLTQLLCAQAGQVIAVELDSGMVKLLRQEYAHLTNLTIIEADILKTTINQLLSPHNPPYKVVANLPYYITSMVLRYLLSATPNPQRLVVMVQKEVAQRIVAKPGKMSLLAVSVQVYGQVEIVQYVPAGAFYPPPKVDSAVVRIDTFANSPWQIKDMKLFFRVVKAGFSQKRKQLKNTLSAGLHRPKGEIETILQAVAIDPKRRAETVTIEEWARLVTYLTTA